MTDTNLYTAEEVSKPKAMCEFCGTEKKYGKLEVLGRTFYIAVLQCDCYQKEKLKLQMIEENEKIQENLYRFRKFSNLSKKEFTFNNWEHNQYTQPAEECFRVFKEFSSSYHLGSQGMIVYGEAGCGKTHLSIALATELANRGVKTVFKNIPTLFEEIFDTFNNSEIKTSDVINPIIESDVVILDDLGAEKPSDFVKSKLYYIINALYNNNATVIVTSNIDNVSDLKNCVGFRAYDRLLEMCNLVHNRGKSYRRYLANDRLNNL
ncbi:MAG: ATP-binding protein [Oscillospiraceae bacterium]